MIVLTNDGNGFGFGISGSRNSGAVVRNIFPGGAADRVSFLIFSFFTAKKSKIKTTKKYDVPTVLIGAFWGPSF